MKTLIKIFALLLSFIAFSCTAQKRVQTTSRAELTTDAITNEIVVANSSTEQNATVLISEDAVPAASATLTMADSQLLALPDGAAYISNDGRASVTVKRTGDGYAVSAQCAEIPRKYIYYEREALRLRNEVNELTAELQKKTRIENQLPQLIPKSFQSRLSRASNGFLLAFC